FRSPPGTYRLIMPRFLRLWLYARAFVTRYPGFLRLRGSPVFSLALYGIIQAGFMMLRFYTTRSIFAIPPSAQSPAQCHVDKTMVTSGEPGTANWNI
ncbi:hypothetical protein, partial [Paraburkholderia mimosarum]|uniref:hypothetical protein n=1 Tax=Paraburkholderia mimosarum TaxID=312026 RepID=UPI001ABBCA3C